MMIQNQDWINQWAIYSPNKIAVSEFETGRELSYGDLNRMSKRLAHHLQNEFGIQKGDRIAVLAENCLEFIILFGAAQKNGCTLVPLNYRLTSAEIDYLLENSSPKMVINEAKFQNLLDGTENYKNINGKWSVEAMKNLCDTSLTQTTDKHFEVISVEEDHPIFILYTAGTTGFPKGAIYSHKMLFWNSINTAMSLIINSESRTINCMPPFHTGGWNVLLTPFLHHGGYTCLMKKFEPEAVLKLLQSEKASIFMGVPTMLKMIAETPAFEKADFSELYYLIVGGEPMPIPLIEQWQQKGVPVRQGYGMTEVGPNLTSLHQSDAVRKKGSIGRPNFYVQITIVDQKGNEVTANEPGELLLKGPMVTPGYWNNPEATSKTIENEWFHTGDMVRQDEEGYLYVVDRIKNMYISGGENVYPAEIERVILEIPAVSAVAIIGLPDSKWGESGKAFVVKRKDKALNADDIIAYCKTKLAKFKVPKSVVFLDELPKNDAGKLNKLALREME
jgi:fatty-acyl-CoA synthase